MANENNSVKNENQDPKLTLYTASAMLAALVASLATVISFILLGNSGFYVTEAYFGGEFESEIIELFVDSLFDTSQSSKIFGLLLAAAILTALSALFTIFITIRAIDPLKKPLMIPGIIASVLSLGAIIMHAVTRGFVADCIDQYEVNFGLEAETSHLFNLFDYCLVGVILNTVILVVMVIGIGVGLLRWEKNGMAY
ncbi:MAG: hypothetical protein ACI4D8_05985 [Wujia sp.]